MVVLLTEWEQIGDDRLAASAEPLDVVDATTREPDLAMRMGARAVHRGQQAALLSARRATFCAQLIDRAVQLGASVEYHRQDDFLNQFGLRSRLSKLRHQELDLARDGDPMERLKVRSTCTEAETLLHPRGLGDFRVLVVRH